jgi:large subunit ribosomal protein L4
MVNVSVLNDSMEPQREVKLPEEVFALPYRRDLIHEAVRAHRAAQRLGTHSTKRRDEVSGSGKKLWKQKHTGRARMGEIRSPLWYHGGITFGPKPRDYQFRLSRKTRQAAVRSLLSERVRRGSLKVIDGLSLKEPRTKEFLARFGKFVNEYRTVMFVDEARDKNLHLASRNVPGVKLTSLNELNIYDLAYYEAVIFTEKALMKLTEGLKP